MHKVCSGVNRLRTVVPVDTALMFDMHVYLTQGDVAFAGRLSEVAAAQFTSWRDQPMVSDQEVLFSVAQLCAEFRYLRKITTYWRQ